MNQTVLMIAIVLLIAPATRASAADSRPNIVLIMADDVGIEGLGCYGGTSYRTPSLDALAKSGIRFSHAYAQPLCTPTRVQLMTGKYNQRNWKAFGILDPSETTFGHRMRDAGYATAIFGKWQLYSYDPPKFPNADERRGIGMHPKDAGFDTYSLYHAEHTEDKGSRYANPTMLEGNAGEDGNLKTYDGQFGEDIWVNKAIEFLDQHREQPAFVYYPMALPHWPFVPTPSSDDWEPNKPVTESLDYAVDMIEYMDTAVGNLLNGLDAKGLRDDTVILFYSDNGTHLDVTSELSDGRTIHGGKATPDQTGIHVPLIVSWPGHIRPAVSDSLVDASDFLPTILDLAGRPLPNDAQLDGLSFAPELLGQRGTKRDAVFFWYDPRPGHDKETFSRHVFALDKHFKYFRDGRLFRLTDRPLEQIPVDTKTANTEERAAIEKLSAVIENQMAGVNEPTLVDAFGEPIAADASKTDRIFLGQGTMSGEATASTVLLQTRLTAASVLDQAGDLPGHAGVAYFEWSKHEDLSNSQRTEVQKAVADHDYIVRDKLTNLQAGTSYFYRAWFGLDADKFQPGPVCEFKTLQGANSTEPTRFIVGSCMNYVKFMHGKLGRASGPETATKEDKRLGFPAFATMNELHPDFFVGTGDIVYYDNPFRVASTVPQLRKCWHEQFQFPRMRTFFETVPAYWSKDDHDFRFNDSDNSGKKKLPSSSTGIDLFREQLPILGRDESGETYRTHRINHDLQIWLTEGRDFRSNNKMKDGPEKTLWGEDQLAWLKRTLKESDAKWKILISPTPLVGPDDASKTDNHANLGGFRHEADAFFAWLNENGIDNFMTVCGDRHWQYHSIHPSGVNEFACGALNDENSRLGVPPGSSKGTDPQALIEQPYISPEPSGGFLVISADNELRFEFMNDQGKRLYEFTK